MSAAIRCCPDLSGAPDAQPSQSAGFVHSFLRLPVFSVPGHCTLGSLMLPPARGYDPVRSSTLPGCGSCRGPIEKETSGVTLGS